MEPAPEWAWLARIRRPQGRKGEVLCEILTDFPEKFAERRHLTLLKAETEAVVRAVELVHHWPHKGGVVLHFAGVDSISAAEELAGLVVAIPRSERAALGEDEFHVADLIGCELIDMAGGSAAMIGRVEDVDRTAGPVPLLIARSEKGEILVPFVKAFLRKVDLESRRIEMSLPEGLTDL